MTTAVLQAMLQCQPINACHTTDTVVLQMLGKLTVLFAQWQRPDISTAVDVRYFCEVRGGLVWSLFILMALSLIIQKAPEQVTPQAHAMTDASLVGVRFTLYRQQPS